MQFTTPILSNTRKTRVHISWHFCLYQIRGIIKQVTNALEKC